jgi:hypothetical protein
MNSKTETWLFGKKSIQASPRVEKSLENPKAGLTDVVSLWIQPLDRLTRTASKIVPP